VDGRCQTDSDKKARSSTRKQERAEEFVRNSTNPSGVQTAPTCPTINGFRPNGFKILGNSAVDSIFADGRVVNGARR